METHLLPLRTRRPFRIARGTTTEFVNFAAKVELEGHYGWGEAAPSGPVTGESLEACGRALRAWQADEGALRGELEASELVPGGGPAPAARAALTAAYLDALGRRRQAPLHRLLNLPAGEILSSITLSLGPVEQVLDEAAARDAEGWTIFKVKLGGPDDEAALRALRDRFPDRRLRVDANEAWSVGVAQQRLALLERVEVEFVEQPLPRDRLEESAALARRFDIPILLDESLRDAESALALVRAEAGDGVNIKLAKCGGPFEVRRIVKVLRDAGWKVMAGCNLESRLGIATAAAFAGILDYADLDGHALLDRDPFEGFETAGGRVATPDRPGIGVDPRTGVRLDRLQA